MKSMQTPRFPLIAIFIFLPGLLWLSFPPEEAVAQNVKITAGQTGINPGTSLYFIAEKEKMYAKHGLDVNIVRTNTAGAVQAMLGGNMEISTGSGAAAFVTATLEGSPPFVLVCSWMNVFPYTIVVSKGILRPQDLKGKTGQIGAPFGTIPDTALRFGLTKLGLDPDKDVKLIQQPRPDAASIVAQMEKGDVQFGPVPPPYDRIAEKRGFHPLISLPELGVPWQNNGEWVQKSYLKSNRATVLRFVRVMADAMKFYFEQKEKTITYLAEFLGSDRADTEYAYQAFLKWADRIPKPKVEGIRTTLDAIKKSTPKATSADPAAFIDTSLIDELMKEGYFK